MKSHRDTSCCNSNSKMCFMHLSANIFIYCILCLTSVSICAATKSSQPDNAKHEEILLDQDLSVITAPADRVESFNRLPPPHTGVNGACPTGVPKGIINLAQVVTRALCNDPRTRQSWAEAVSQAAQVGIERSAYLPSAEASVGGGPDRVWQNEQAANDNNAIGSTVGNSNSASLDFTWTLFDFGQRAAAVKSARQTLLAATAIHDATVQTVFLEAAGAYYDLISAQNALDNAKEVEEFNRHTLTDAEARAKRDGGIEESEKLQAQSSLEQAALDLNSAQGDLLKAQGELAVALGFAPNIKLSVDTNDASAPDKKLDRTIDQLMEQALSTHPEIRAAQARVEAALANIDEAKRAHLPTVKLVQGNEWDRDVWGGKQWENTLALRMNIPLFDRSRHFRKQAAIADLDNARADMVSSRRKIALDVWSAYQSLKTQRAAIDRSKNLLDTARKLLKAEQNLYKSGDGDMLDLLYAQQTVADASQGRLDALTGWRVARLKLAASLGQLGFWAIREPTDKK